MHVGFKPLQTWTDPFYTASCPCLVLGLCTVLNPGSWAVHVMVLPTKASSVSRPRLTTFLVYDTQTDRHRLSPPHPHPSCGLSCWLLRLQEAQRKVSLGRALESAVPGNPEPQHPQTSPVLWGDTPHRPSAWRALSPLTFSTCSAVTYNVCLGHCCILFQELRCYEPPPSTGHWIQVSTAWKADVCTCEFRLCDNY